MAETVLILGGGVGGLVTATELRKALPKPHRVVLVEREKSFVFAPSLLWLITGGRTAENISRPLARLARKGIESEHQIKEVEPVSRTLRFTNGVDAHYDLLANVPPHRAPAVVRELGLVSESGWISADRSTPRNQVSRGLRDRRRGVDSAGARQEGAESGSVCTL
jgi:NADPH-dependent 2,4-dienoyl-CoA reductase/sulfur reductase-like enzyme